MTKKPVPPQPDDDEEETPLSTFDQETLDAIMTGLEHPEEDLFGDPDYMPTSKCLGCGNNPWECTCQPDS